MTPTETQTESKVSAHNRPSDLWIIYHEKMATHDHKVFSSIHNCLFNILEMVTKIEAILEATTEKQKETSNKAQHERKHERQYERQKELEFTRSKVATHNKPTDLWMIYRDKVYNVTPYYRIHPGGDALLNRAGKDATNILWTIVDHALSMSVVEGILDDCYIGELSSNDRPREQQLSDYR